MFLYRPVDNGDRVEVLIRELPEDSFARINEQLTLDHPDAVLALRDMRWEPDLIRDLSDHEQLREAFEARLVELENEWSDLNK